MDQIKSELKNQIEKRRTFAIISHPDAGKTTLTEKFLLYGGAINQAGSVKGKATATPRGVGLDGDREGDEGSRLLLPCSSLTTGDTASISWTRRGIRISPRIPTGR